MARKKRHVSTPNPETIRDRPFHAPFEDLKARWRQIPRASTAAEPATPSPQLPLQHPKPSPRPRQSPPPTQSVSDSEQALFLNAMSGVTPLPEDRRGRVAKQPPMSRRNHRLTDETAVLSDLRDLVEGRSTFMIQYTDEYMEGVAPGVDRRLAQRLHQGEFAIQSHLDLHGFTVNEARLTVDRFLTNAYTNGQRCVRLVHGRGHNSINNQPVLKEQVRLWLSHGRLSRMVLAFATAPLTDGGAGAVYVLLRRVTPTSRHK